MTKENNRIVEHLFFFGLLGITAYIMWQIIAPFIGALALAAILATVSYPIYEWSKSVSPRRNDSVAALIAIIIVVVMIVAPLSFIGYLVVDEAVSFYTTANRGEVFTLAQPLVQLETTIQSYAPGFSFDLEKYARQGAGWLASNIGNIFASTASTIFLLFIAFFGLFYLYRDGREFTKRLIYLSPLPDDQDEKIVKRLASSVNAIVGGVLTIALIQGTLSAIGLTIFGIEQAVLLGSVAAIGALIPTVGTAIVFVPVIGLLLLSGQIIPAVGLAIWGVLAVGLVDNLIGPKLMSRGTTLHPFLVLISVLGGIVFFGPIGFVLGPICLSFFMVLLELYSMHMSPNEKFVQENGAP